jgi:hypothetical protein
MRLRARARPRRRNHKTGLYSADEAVFRGAPGARTESCRMAESSLLKWNHAH